MPDPNEPRDRFHLIYTSFLVHGIGILMPWNMFITAIGYFTNYKLSKAYIGYDFPYTPNFMQYLTFCSQIPNIFFGWLNIFAPIKGSLNVRIIWSIIVAVVIFIVTVLMAMFDSSGWPQGFFWLTMICVVVLNMATGVYQNTIFGMAAKLPFQYTGAVVLGNNICGCFTTLIQIISQVSTSNWRMAAIYYFITALLVLFVCLDMYFAVPLNRYYRYYELKEKKDNEQRLQVSKGVVERIPYVDILKKSWPQYVNVFLIFFVTLAVYPAIQANIQKSNKNFIVSDDFYVSVMCFVTFNLFAMIGSVLPSFIIWPSANWLWIPVTLRLLFIPAYLFCNYQVTGTKRVFPVWITNDWIYWIIGVLMALTSGYLSSLAMMFAPGYVEERYAPVAGMFAAAFLITGIFVGILISFLWPWVISNIG